MPIYLNNQIIVPPDVKDWRDKLKYLASVDLFVFAKLVLGYDLLVERVHRPFAYFLTDSFLDAVVFPKMQAEGLPLPKKAIFHSQSRRRRRKLLLSTRDSYKTTLVSRSLPLWILSHDPNASILLCSEIKDNTVLLLREIKQQIETNLLFRALYGDWVSNIWQSEQIVISPRNKAISDPSLRVSGTTSSTVGSHPDVIIFDDVHSIMNTHSQDAIDGVIQYWSDTKAQLKENGFFYIVGTRYCLTDLYSHIINNFSDQFDILEQYALKPNGEFWFPEHINEKYLADRRPHTERERELYNAWYFGVLSPVSERKLDINKIKFFDGIDFSKPPLVGMNLYCVIDPAVSKKKESSNTAIVIGGLNGDGEMCLVDVDFGHWAPDETEKRALDIIKKYYKYLKGVHPEEVGMSAFFVESLKQALIRENLILRFEPVKPKGLSKADRILKIGGLEKFINEGKFYCRRGLDAFLREAEFFPKGSTMDILDATAYLFYVAERPPKINKAVLSKDEKEYIEFIEREIKEYQNEKTLVDEVYGVVNV